jgi:V/A-type H+-transporting ATPase subunit D
MLERKRDLLARLVHDRLSDCRQRRREAAAALEEAYEWLTIAELRMGTDILREASVGLEPAVAVRIVPRSSVGVEYPTVRVERRRLQPVGLMWTDPSLDEARRHLADVAVRLARQAEAETALLRLIADQRKTQKRVNALKYNVIPSYREAIRFIRSTLEEDERNSSFQMQLLRDKTGRV